MTYLRHKLWKIKVIREAECECGWKSCMHIGKGANGQALSEWRGHIRTCKIADGHPDPWGLD